MSNYKKSTSNWLKQRFSAVAILLFTISFFVISSKYIDKETGFFDNIDILFPLLSINLICIYHGSLGMHVIIEDYISCLSLRHGVIFLINFFAFITIIVTIATLFFLVFVATWFGMSLISFIAGILGIVVFIYLLLKS